MDFESPVELLIELREECNRILFDSQSIGEALSQIDRLIDDSIIAAKDQSVARTLTQPTSPCPQQFQK